MNICFVTAPIATEFKDQDEIDSCLVEPAVSGPQLGILSLASVLEHRGDEVRILDLDQAYLGYLRTADKRHSYADVAGRLITAEGADVYGFSSICSSYPLTVRIAKVVKAAQPNSIILFGGPQASVVDQQTLAAFPFIDFILRGEAECTLPLFLDELAREGRLSGVPGLSYRLQAEPRRNSSAPIIEDLDSIPLPAYHLVGGLHGFTRASLELGRGCPFACTFCSTNDFFRRRFRLRSPERVLGDMRELAASYGVREFELVHDMFTIDRKRVVLFCESMLASSDHFRWSCSARTDCVDEELLDLMSRAGCVGIFYGVEAGSQQLQKIIDKHLDLQRVRQIVAETERLGIRSTVSLITGFPEETEADLRETLRMFMFSARHAQSSPQLNILAPLAGTPVHLKYRDKMTLGELCSEMSQQGVSQDAEDLQLIEEHPDIFPNFYLLPTPHLDRTCLLELREFALNAVGHFRWLLCAIDQSAQEFYEFFLTWCQHRLSIRPGITGPQLRKYYKSYHFRKEFLSFIGSSPAGQAAMVRALLEFEAAWSSTSNSDSPKTPAYHTVSESDALRPTVVPVRSDSTKVIQLSYDIQSVINALKQRTELAWSPRPHFYITLKTADTLKQIYKASWELGRLLQACDGRHNVTEIVKMLVPEFRDIRRSHRSAFVTGLIEAAVKEGLVEIHPATVPLPRGYPGTPAKRKSI